MSQWMAEITNNPENAYDLYVELLEDDEYRARIAMSDAGALVLQVYPTTTDVALPVDWLMSLLEMARKELQPADSLVSVQKETVSRLASPGAFPAVRQARPAGDR